MTSESKAWESVKAEYLHKVEKVLSSVNHPRKEEVLEDVRSHLDERFAGLGADERTWENMQNIITEMGPPGDYAELLDPEASRMSRGVGRRQLLWLGLAVVVIIAGVILVSLAERERQRKGEWVQAGSPVVARAGGRITDSVDHPFVSDAAVIGAWKTIDFVTEIEDFQVGQRKWDGDLWVNHLVFEEGGGIRSHWWTWTKGLVLDRRNKTASAYEIRDMNGTAYMFLQWKSGDYMIRGMRPKYYVLKRVSFDSVKYNPVFGDKAELPATSAIDERGHIVDKIDYPFVNDPEVMGAWESVDVVSNIEDFKPGTKSFPGDLYLKELFMLENGKTNWACTWTKGLILHSVDKTASKYLIKEMGGTKYMFFEWKSGDYTMRRMKPKYCVLKKAPNKPYVESKTSDRIDYPFVNDTQVIGVWKSVDFVENIDDFKRGAKNRRGDLYLKEMIILEEGRTEGPWMWTKGLIIHPHEKTAARYEIKEIGRSTYMFFEWKSGDYTIRHMEPQYYVLEKVRDAGI